MEIPVISFQSDATSSVEVTDSIFGIEPRADILHRMVTYQLAKRRAGTHDVKNRSEIARTNAKMFKQKGTGRARHGSGRVNIFRGGGRAFGPTPRSHAISLPKKVRQLAMKHALSAKAKAGQLYVLDEATMAEPKTKTLAARFAALPFKSAFVVAGVEVDRNLELAARNLPHLQVVAAAGINVYDVLKKDALVLSRESLAQLEERLA